MVRPRNLKETLRNQAPIALAIALTVLLVVLALLQQSWLAKVSEAERSRARAHVDSAAAAFSRDFNEPLSRLAFDFLPLFESHGEARGEAPEPAAAALGASLARRLERWRATASEPDLLAALWLAEREPGRVVFRRLDEGSRSFLPPAGPPPALDDLARRIAALPAGGDSSGPRPGAAIELLDAKIPALIVPLAGPAPDLLPDVIAFTPDENPERRPLAEALHWRMAMRGADRWLVLQLNRPVIEKRVLPLLAERHFGDDGFGLRVVAKDDPGEPIFASGRPMPADATIERSVDLFGPLVFSRAFRPPGAPFEAPLPLRAPAAPVPPAPPLPPESPPAPAAIGPFDETAPAAAPDEPPAPAEHPAPRPPSAPSQAPAPPAPRTARPPAPPPPPFGVFLSRAEGTAPFELGEGRWRLEVFHLEGSLDAAIDRARNRNLTLAFGILVVLGAAMLFLAASARKAQALARRQLELVAGVTHELLTPLAAMKSAGQNLRDGVVREAPKVERYGELIVKESDRLSGLVGQVLSWAGLESEATTARRELLDPAEVAREALEDLRPGLETADFEVAFEARPGLPAVAADPAALRQALGNLIANAIKYGKPAEGRPYLRLAVEAEKGGRRVAFTVADRGPGIAAEDLPHIFEPFYRGRRVVASNLAGAGLGLALVRRIAENHGGELTASQAGGGASFSLLLPAAEAS